MSKELITVRQAKSFCERIKGANSLIDTFNTFADRSTVLAYRSYQGTDKVYSLMASIKSPFETTSLVLQTAKGFIDFGVLTIPLLELGQALSFPMIEEAIGRRIFIARSGPAELVYKNTNPWFHRDEDSPRYSGGIATVDGTFVSTNMSEVLRGLQEMVEEFFNRQYARYSTNAWRLTDSIVSLDALKEHKRFMREQKPVTEERN